MKKFSILVLISLTSCNLNSNFKRTLDGEIETKIQYYNTQGDFVDAILEKPKKSIKKFNVSKSILVKGVFKYSNFEHVLMADMNETAANLCGSMENVNKVSNTFNQGDNFILRMEANAEPRKEKYNYFLNLFSVVNCK